MKTIEGTVISAIDKGEVAEILTDLGVYGINKVVRSFINFRTPLKKGDIVLLTIDPKQNNTLLGIEIQGD